MTQHSASQNTSGLADGMAHAAEHAQASVETFAHHTQADMAMALQALIPKLNRMADQLGAVSHRGIQSVASGSHYLSEQAHHAADATRGYIRKEPTTAVLLAAGLGALLVAAWVAASQARPR